MASIKMGYNKRVAIVYFSAALLIVSVGVRMVGSLMAEGGQELTPLDWIMITGIALEFFVLTYYSSFIWSQPDDEGKAPAVVQKYSGPTDEDIAGVREIQKNYAELVNQSLTNIQILKELTAQLCRNESQLQQFSSNFTTQLQNNETQLQQLSSNLVVQLRGNEAALQVSARELITMEKTLHEFIDGKIKEQVQKEVGEIMSSLVTQRMTNR